MTKRITTLIVALCVLTAHSALAAEQVTYYHNNAIGSPVAATDETGALLWQQSYDLWGDPLVSGPVDPRAFTGAPRDADTGNSDLGARWYNPLLGRFLAPDPVGFHPSNIHSFNRYAYGANNPYVFVDPNGEIAIAALIWGAITVASTADTAYASYQTYQSDGITAAATGAAINLIAGPLGKVKKIARAARRVLTRSGTRKADAHSVVDATRLRGQLAGQEIAGGHSFTKHVLQRREFEGIGIRTRSQFAKHIENVINNPTATKRLYGGRTGYWDEASGTVVIRNPRAADGGTAFRPNNGRAYFNNLR